jgi:hypothetical protein
MEPKKIFSDTKANLCHKAIVGFSNFDLFSLLLVASWHFWLSKVQYLLVFSVVSDEQSWSSLLLKLWKTLFPQEYLVRDIDEKAIWLDNSHEDTIIALLSFL